jgi:hypothetical protein
MPTIDLGELEVKVSVFPLEGRRPYDVIQDYVSGCTTALQQLKDNQLEAINNFMTRMAFKSSAEATPDVTGTIFKKVFDLAAEKILEHVGIEGVASLADVKEVIDAVSEELERAEAAHGEFQVASYMTSLRRRVTDAYKNKILTVTKSGAALDVKFAQIGAEEGDPYKDGDKAAVGGQGKFLNDLAAAASKLVDGAASTPLIETEHELLRSWITDNRAGGAGMTDLGFLRGSISNGRILIKFDDDDELDQVKLFVAHKSGNAADLLNDVLRERGLKIFELGVPVIVSMWGPGFNWGSKTDAYTTTLNGAPSYSQVPNGGPEPDKLEDRWVRIINEGKLDNIKSVEGG